MRILSLLCMAAVAALPAFAQSGDETTAPADKPSFEGRVLYSMPAPGVVNILAYADAGVGQITWCVNVDGKSFKPNYDCTETIKLLYEGEMMFEMPVTASPDRDENAYLISEPPNFLAMGDFEDYDSPLKNTKFLGMVFNDYKFIGEPGEYTLSIPEDFFILDGIPMAGYDMPFLIEKAWESSPEDGALNLSIDELNAFEIRFIGNIFTSNFSSASRYSQYASRKMHITFNDEDVTDRYTVTPIGGTMRFVCDKGEPLAGEGVLKVDIEHGFFTLNRESPSVPVSLTLSTLSGSVDVANLPAEDSEEAIYYTLSGMQVSPEALTPGIYIRCQGTSVTKIVISGC